MNWYWLSFADPDKPKGAQFLGVSMVLASSFEDAICKAHELGINPGGEVMCAELDYAPDEKLQHRLLSAEDIKGISEKVHETH